MRLLALIIFSLLLAAGIGAYIEDDARLVTVVFSGWTVQANSIFFVVSIVIFFE